ncbi:MAG: hypothetical protein KAY32_05905 [Candidatus Eisenbacteria sp.]|nr:hypothetical protein [Candidatus Eisenbacteria bacterium]
MDRDPLAGRFFLNRCLHWSYGECWRAFGWNLDQWLYYGGYPGAIGMRGGNSVRWGHTGGGDHFESSMR